MDSEDWLQIPEASWNITRYQILLEFSDLNEKSF